jgi:hypothetical protein
MCILICAHSNVCEWFDIPSARAYRQTLQLCPMCPSSASREELPEQDNLPSSTDDSFEFDELAPRRVMKRSAWLQAYCKYRTHVAEHSIRLANIDGSSRDWQKAFETIAKTWGRILSLVGLRW